MGPDSSPCWRYLISLHGLKADAVGDSLVLELRPGVTKGSLSLATMSWAFFPLDLAGGVSETGRVSFCGSVEGPLGQSSDAGTVCPASGVPLGEFASPLDDLGDMGRSPFKLIMNLISADAILMPTWFM